MEEDDLDLDHSEEEEAVEEDSFDLDSIIKELEDEMNERMDIIGQNGNNGEHYSVDDDEIWEAMSLKGILYENKEDR